MKRAVVLSISAAAVMVWAVIAAADSPKLKGSYGVTGTANCIQTAADDMFDPNDFTTPMVGSVESFAAEGTRTFNGDGTGTVTGSTVGVEFFPFDMSGGATASTFTYTFHYSVNGDGTWTSTMDANSYVGTVTAGPRAGQSYTIDAIPPFTGQISQNGMTLTAAMISDPTNPQPSTETVTFIPGGHHHGATVTRICHRSRVLINLK
jgi:hypothetical protein